MSPPLIKKVREYEIPGKVTIIDAPPGTSCLFMADDAKPLADFGQDELAPPEETPKRVMNALIPILRVIVVTISGLWITGTEAVDKAAFTSTFKYIQDVFSNANSFNARTPRFFLVWLRIVTISTMLRPNCPMPWASDFWECWWVTSQPLLGFFPGFRFYSEPP
jgi:hypothetical protein